MTTRTLSLIAIALWVVGAGAVGWLFFAGQTEVAPDGRQRIQLSAAETDLILSEMRGMLEGVQGLAEGLADNDRGLIADAARAVGGAEAEAVPKSLMLKLPLEFKSFGVDTHDEFDALAAMAEAGAGTTEMTAKLSDILLRCTTCHAGYRLH